MNFVDALRVAQQGFDTWAAKPHNAKWFKRIDGTPIPNDLVVCIAEAFIATEAARVPEGLAVRVREDGTWLDFSASNGKKASLRIESMAEKYSGIIGQALQQWCNDYRALHSAPTHSEE